MLKAVLDFCCYFTNYQKHSGLKEYLQVRVQAGWAWIFFLGYPGLKLKWHFGWFLFSWPGGRSRSQNYFADWWNSVFWCCRMEVRISPLTISLGADSASQAVLTPRHVVPRISQWQWYPLSFKFLWLPVSDRESQVARLGLPS